MDQGKERQLKMLQSVYENWMPPTPAFKANHEGVPKGMIPYISCSDVHDYNYIIRVVPTDVFLYRAMTSSRRQRMEQSSHAMTR